MIKLPDRKLRKGTLGRRPGVLRFPVRFSVTISEEQNNRLLAYMGKMDCDKTAIIRWALDKILPKTDPNKRKG